jgi:hypothetical protein
VSPGATHQYHCHRQQSIASEPAPCASASAKFMTRQWASHGFTDPRGLRVSRPSMHELRVSAASSSDDLAERARRAARHEVCQPMVLEIGTNGSFSEHELESGCMGLITHQEVQKLRWLPSASSCSRSRALPPPSRPWTS